MASIDPAADVHIRNLEAECVRHKAQIRGLSLQLAAKDERIAHEIRRVHEMGAELEQARAERRDLADGFAAELAAKDARIAELERERDEARAEAEDAREHALDLQTRLRRHGIEG